MRLDADAIFAPLDLEGRRTILVAISGGSDSTALLLLFRAFAEKHGLRIVAATVDHRLRAGSACEARHVASLCETLGIEHRTLAWTGAKPATGIPAAARLARYALLAGCARVLGADVVLLGHTADDQAETIAMRTARGTSGRDRRGDAGMAPAVLFDDAIWFVRPLLGAGRGKLRAFLQSGGTTWIDDPTNLDPAYERARLRASCEMPDIAANGAEGRLIANEAAARQIAAHATLPSPGLFRLDRKLFAEDGVLAFRMCLAVAGGAEHLPDANRSRTLFDRIRSGWLRATLSRAVVDARRDAVWLYRENRDLPSPSPGGFSWDRRWRLTRPLDPGLTIAPIGAAAEASIVPDGATQGLVRHALEAEPGLWRGGEFVAPLDAAHGVDAHRTLGPWHQFLPSFDIAPAAALRALVGLPKLPATPWRDHNRSEA